jgi:hypothetical protein
LLAASVAAGAAAQQPVASGGPDRPPVYLGALVEFRGGVALAGRSGSWSGLCRKGEGGTQEPALPAGLRFHPIDRSKANDSIALDRPKQSAWVAGRCLFGASTPVSPKLHSARVRVPGWDGWNDLVLLVSGAREPELIVPDSSSLPKEREKEFVQAFLGSRAIRPLCSRDAAACSPSDVVVARAASYASGPQLAELRFEAGKRGCDEDPYAHCSGVWIVSHPGGGPQPLDAGVDDRGWAMELMPLAVSDFDGDSKVEHLFWLDAYNENGLVLYYDDFARSAVFSYGYH